jgi:hypothetical protein
MLSALYVMQNITSELQSQVRLSLWSENVALVCRLSNLIEYDPISAFLKSDPDLYCGIISAAKQLSIEGIDHINGHQDRSGRTLNNIEMLNVLANKLATQAFNEEISVKAEWHKNPWTNSEDSWKNNYSQRGNAPGNSRSCRGTSRMAKTQTKNEPNKKLQNRLGGTTCRHV